LDLKVTRLEDRGRKAREAVRRSAIVVAAVGMVAVLAAMAASVRAIVIRRARHKRVLAALSWR
jgi:hypothetical protein